MHKPDYRRGAKSDREAPRTVHTCSDAATPTRRNGGSPLSNAFNPLKLLLTVEGGTRSRPLGTGSVIAETLSVVLPTWVRTCAQQWGHLTSIFTLFHRVDRAKTL